MRLISADKEHVTIRFTREEFQFMRDLALAWHQQSEIWKSHPEISEIETPQEWETSETVAARRQGREPRSYAHMLVSEANRKVAEKEAQTEFNMFQFYEFCLWDADEEGKYDAEDIELHARCWCAHTAESIRKQLEEGKT